MNKNDKLDVDFKSLKYNSDWKAVYKKYQDNIAVFSELIEDMVGKYKLTKIEARDVLLSELVSCHYSRKQRKLLSENNRIKWLLLYISVMLGIFLNGIISLLFFKKKIVKDVLFEEMFSEKGWSFRFYRYINHLMINDQVSQAVLYTHPGISTDFVNKSIEGWNGDVINRQLSSILFDFKNSYFVLRNDFFYFFKLYRLSKNINLIYLYMRFLRKYLVYNSQIKNIKAEVIVAAGDYYWNPIKYILYKKNIKHVILLQHNFKNEYLHNRLLQYCDYYYAHSNQAVERIEGVPFSKKYSIGSFQLVPFLHCQPLEYDIVFINQTVDNDLTNEWPDLDQEALRDSYYMLIDNFKEYLKQYDNVKAVYVAKGSTINSKPSTIVKEKYKELCNIEFIGSYGVKTFEIIKKSKLIINMYSSVGFESYGFDKKVLWINYNKCCDLFRYDTEVEDLHVMINDTSYKAFEKKVNLLLSDNKEVDRHYKKLKEKYMNIQENPAKIVADKIQEILKNS